MCTLIPAVQYHQGVSVSNTCRMSTLQSNTTTPERILHKSPDYIRSCGNNNNSLFGRFYFLCNYEKKRNGKRLRNELNVRLILEFSFRTQVYILLMKYLGFCTFRLYLQLLCRVIMQ